MEANLIPAELRLVKGMNELVAVQRVLRVVRSLVVHGSLHHVEAELPILLHLEVLQGRLFKKEGNDHGRALYFRGDPLKIGGTLIQSIKYLVHLRSKYGELYQ